MSIWDLPKDAPLHAPADPPAPKKNKLRRFTWVRLHHDLLTDTRWDLVAVMAGSERARVEALVVRLETYASQNRPRGSVDGFNVAALAASWRCDKDELARIYAALEHHDVGWLDQDCIVSFWDRNPDEDDDPTAADRSRRYRQRNKVIKRALAEGRPAAEALAAAALSFPPSRGVTRDAVTVTVRPDQTKTAAGEAAKKQSDTVPPLAVSATDSGESGDNREDSRGLAELWLATEGLRMVVERLGETRTLCETRMARWQRDLQGDAAALAQVLREVDRADYVGARFHNMVVDAIRRQLVRANGPQLPLGPALASLSERNGERKRGHG